MEKLNESEILAPKDMLKSKAKKIMTILHLIILLNWPDKNCLRVITMQFRSMN